MTNTPARPSSNWQVADYLGRVLDEEDEPTGTCFQVAPGVLVTAWHVLDAIGASAEDRTVRVDPLLGGEAFDARVTRLDPVHDLAVMAGDRPFAATVGALAATSGVQLRTEVTVTGHAILPHAGRRPRFLNAIATWAGGTMWDDSVPVGRMTADAVVPGMSGAPVIRESDGAVVGVVSGRFNSPDGWLAGTVWVVRTEDLTPLLTGIAGVAMQPVFYAEPVDLVLTVTSDRVRLTGPDIDIHADHGGVQPGLTEAVNEARRARAQNGAIVRARARTQQAAGELALGRAGRLLGESFMPDEVAVALKRVLNAAGRGHQAVRIGLAVAPELAGLPWEALPSPGGGPLALHPLVSLYRKTDAAPPRLVPGPLQIVVAIAAPDSGGGPLLDYERELRNVLAAVRVARQGEAQVRVVPFATPTAIREELDRGAAHVLHVSGHGSPGRLDLENDDGTVQAVNAEEFIRDAIPPGKMPPVITLAACYTDAAAADGGPSFAAQLCSHGATAVIGTETSVTDVYATRLLARLYAALARPRDPDVISALSEARRNVQRELETSMDKRDEELAALDEWATVSILAATGTVPLLDPKMTEHVPASTRLRIAGLATRNDFYFVGRRPEQRQWPTDLVDLTTAGIVIHGIGGTGKTTLAAEITARIQDREPNRLLINLTGSLTLEGLLQQVISTVRRELLVRGQEDGAARALDVVSRTDLPWQDRLAMLQSHVLSAVALLLVLDNFEDNLRLDGLAEIKVQDEVLADLLGAWVSNPGASRLLITSRHPFTLPDGAEQNLSFRQLGPLSRAETMKLAWSLPELDRLSENELERVWRLAGGHPRSLEYLDALLAGGSARYPDVTARLDEAISRRLYETDRQQWLAARTSLDAALAEVVSIAADEVLLRELLTRIRAVPGAEDLLLGVSVYREPIDVNALLFQVGEPDSAASYIPAYHEAHERAHVILNDAGISNDAAADWESLPAGVRASLAPHIAELRRLPTPPFRAPAQLAVLVEAAQVSSLLTVNDGTPEARFFVHRWTASELAQHTGPEDPRLRRAHQHASAYWLWRVKAWPQDQEADLYDMLEARYHLLKAGETEEAVKLSAAICSRLHTRGAWDEELSLIRDTLTYIPLNSAAESDWADRLGTLALDRGEYVEAERQYRRALKILEKIGDEHRLASIYHRYGMLAGERGNWSEAERRYQRSLEIRDRLGDHDRKASTYHQLGNIAFSRRDKEEAERQYRLALEIFERLDNQIYMSNTYHQLGMLAQDRKDHAEAERYYQRSLEIRERLGDQDGIAGSHNQLGSLASNQGNYTEAAYHYQLCLEIRERLGDQVGMASTYHQLGSLARDLGDYAEAERQYQRALIIAERLGHPMGEATCCNNLGSLALEQGNYAEAERYYRRALSINEILDDKAGVAGTHRNLSILAQLREIELSSFEPEAG